MADTVIMVPGSQSGTKLLALRQISLGAVCWHMPHFTAAGGPSRVLENVE